jgi:hypothetical protein
MTGMRAVAWGGGVVVVAGLILLAVAGFPGAVPILISAAALVAMIGLGGAMGGRHTPNVPPVVPGSRLDMAAGEGPVPSDEGADGATTET